MRTFEHINLFTTSLPAPLAQLPSAPDHHDTTATTVQRAEAYLYANCAMCHQPGGPTPVNIDFRWGVSLSQRNIFNIAPTGTTFGVENARRLAPGDAARSVAFLRMFTLDVNRMPPLGTSRLDGGALGLVAAWITLMTTVDGPEDIWVDFLNSDTEFGTVTQPFNTLSEGANNVASGGTVHMLPGNSSETPTVSKPSILQSAGGPVRVGTP